MVLLLCTSSASYSVRTRSTVTALGTRTWEAKLKKITPTWGCQPQRPTAPDWTRLPFFRPHRSEQLLHETSQLALLTYRGSTGSLGNLAAGGNPSRPLSPSSSLSPSLPLLSAIRPPRRSKVSHGPVQGLAVLE